jgi:6-phospho-beta-glucosidase
VNLAVLGGSAVATVQLADALAAWPGADRPPLTLSLHGRDPDKLSAVAARCAAVLAAAPGPPATVVASTRYADVLPGADLVLVQVRVGGLAARAFDETFPWVAGIPGEETLGPGGLANGLRTLAALAPTWDAIGELCAGAVVIVLTNPAGLVRTAAQRAGLSAVEVCDSPLTHLAGVASVLDRAVADVTAGYVGMNHAGWWVPDAPDALDALAPLGPVDADVVRAFGAVPLPYLRYYLHPERMFAAQQGAPPRARALMEVERAALAALAERRSPDAGARPAPWYTLGVVPFLRAWSGGPELVTVLGTANNGRLPGLADDATVEGPTRVGAGRLETLPAAALPALPALAAGVLARHGRYEELAVAAAAEPGDIPLLRALLANPMVPSAEQAHRLLDAMRSADPAVSGLAVPGAAPAAVVPA